jgi:hypothetical protein
MRLLLNARENMQIAPPEVFYNMYQNVEKEKNEPATRLAGEMTVAKRKTAVSRTAICHFWIAGIAIFRVVSQRGEANHTKRMSKLRDTKHGQNDN